MSSYEALIKSLIWRFCLSIPVSLFITYLFLGSFLNSLALTATASFVSTVLYYLFDIFWFSHLGDAFGFDRVIEEDSASSRDDLKNQTI
tara:strand:+ start:189 stop:455 length:267 start_codon:yes stop_codon:yes gene_type:complete